MKRLVLFLLVLVSPTIFAAANECVAPLASLKLVVDEARMTDAQKYQRIVEFEKMLDAAIASNHVMQARDAVNSAKNPSEGTIYVLEIGETSLGKLFPLSSKRFLADKVRACRVAGGVTTILMGSMVGGMAVEFVSATVGFVSATMRREVVIDYLLAAQLAGIAGLGALVIESNCLSKARQRSMPLTEAGRKGLKELKALIQKAKEEFQASLLSQQRRTIHR